MLVILVRVTSHRPSPEPSSCDCASQLPELLAERRTVTLREAAGPTAQRCRWLLLVLLSWIYEPVSRLGVQLELVASVETGTGPKRRPPFPRAVSLLLRVVSCCHCCVHDASEHGGSLGSWWDDDAQDLVCKSPEVKVTQLHQLLAADHHEVVGSDRVGTTTNSRGLRLLELNRRPYLGGPMYFCR
jgi:hypothetical protein